MISVVLVEPCSPGNVGAVARSMKNFGLKKLYLVNPQCNHLDQEALWRAKHAKDVLKKCTVLRKFSELKKFNTLVATTAALGTASNVARIPLSPEELGEKYFELNRANSAIVFGRDTTGLTNQEILKCDIVATIPSSPSYRALNLSHSVAIILYELFRNSRKKKTMSSFTPASSEEKEVIMRLISQMLKRMPFHFDTQRDTQRKIWKRIMGKAMLNRREAFAVIGFLKKASKLK